MLVSLGNRLTLSVHCCPRTRPRITRNLLLYLCTPSVSSKRGERTYVCASVLPESLVRFSPFCSGSWSLSDSKARTGARGGLRSNCDRSCRVGGSDAARGSPAMSARTVARRRGTLPDLWLSFVTHLRYRPKTSEGVIRCHLRSEEVSRGNFGAFEEWTLPKMVCETCKKSSL